MTRCSSGLRSAPRRPRTTSCAAACIAVPRIGNDVRRSFCLHGWNAELCYRYLFPHLASHLGRARVNTVIFELPYHMHRRPRLGSVRDFISTDLRAMLEATRRAIADVRVLCRWLRAWDPNAIGLWAFVGRLVCGFHSARLERQPVLCLGPHHAHRPSGTGRLPNCPFCAPVRQSLSRRQSGIGRS